MAVLFTAHLFCHESGYCGGGDSWFSAQHDVMTCRAKKNLMRVYACIYAQII